MQELIVPPEVLTDFAQAVEAVVMRRPTERDRRVLSTSYGTYRGFSIAVDDVCDSNDWAVTPQLRKEFHRAFKGQ